MPSTPRPDVGPNFVHAEGPWADEAGLGDHLAGAMSRFKFANRRERRGGVAHQSFAAKSTLELEKHPMLFAATLEAKIWSSP